MIFLLIVTLHVDAARRDHERDRVAHRGATSAADRTRASPRCRRRFTTPRRPSRCRLPRAQARRATPPYGAGTKISSCAQGQMPGGCFPPSLAVPRRVRPRSRSSPPLAARSGSRLLVVLAGGALVLGAAASVAMLGSNRVSRTPAAATPVATAAAAAPPLELVALGHERDGDRLTVRGVVRNPAVGHGDGSADRGRLRSSPPTAGSSPAAAPPSSRPRSARRRVDVRRHGAARRRRRPVPRQLQNRRPRRAAHLDRRHES